MLLHNALNDTYSKNEPFSAKIAKNRIVDRIDYFSAYISGRHK